MMVIAVCVIVGLALAVLVAAREVRKALEEVNELPGGVEEYQGEDET